MEQHVTLGFVDFACPILRYMYMCLQGTHNNLLCTRGGFLPLIDFGCTCWKSRGGTLTRLGIELGEPVVHVAKLCIVVIPVEPGVRT